MGGKYTNVIFGRGSKRRLIKTFFGDDSIIRATNWLEGYIKDGGYASADFYIRVIYDDVEPDEDELAGAENSEREEGSAE